jgi:hypothetical protein
MVNLTVDLPGYDYLPVRDLLTGKGRAATAAYGKVTLSEPLRAFESVILKRLPPATL